MSTYFPSGKGLAENRKWFVVDAQGKTVGRLATEVARILSGKNNPAWTPFMDMGDHVVVINAKGAVFTGSKNDQKLYRRHTLYPGGLRETTVKEMFEKKPEKVIELAVKGSYPQQGWRFCDRLPRGERPRSHGLNAEPGSEFAAGKGIPIEWVDSLRRDRVGWTARNKTV